MSSETENSVKLALSKGDTETAGFHAKHPDFNLAAADLFRQKPHGASAAAWAGLQRQKRMLAVTGDGEVARRLVDAGLDSAHRIAGVPLHRFLRHHQQSIFGGDEDAARAVHGRATAVKAAAKHVYANIHASLASPHYAAMLSNNVDSGLGDYFKGEPSYQDLFGSLNYCQCQQCASIFGPAAYFLDVMRIIDDYITDPNTTRSHGNIPTGYTLAERRPDLFELPLTCAHTDQPVPTLQIVNQVLARAIGGTSAKNTGTAAGGSARSITLGASASGTDGAYNGMSVLITGGTGVGQLRGIADYTGATKLATVTEAWTVVPDTTSTYTVAVDPYQTVAVAPYPFNLPANLPLTEIRTYLGALSSSLEATYQALSAPLISGTAQAGAAASLTLAATASSATGAYVSMQLVLVVGAGSGQARQIIAYDGATKIATVDRPWDVVPGATTQYAVYDTLPADREATGLSIELCNIVTTPLATNAAIAPYYGYTTIDLTALAKAQTFETSTGLDWDQLQSLLTQGLSDAEVGAGVANNFFINSTGEGLPPMAIVIDNSVADAPFYSITNLSLLRLDRLNRFIRLAAALGWDYEALDWAMQSLGATEITEAAIKTFAGIRRLQISTSLSVVELCGFWAPLKTIGRGNGAAPTDLFDRLFNSPPLLKGQDPYTSVAPIPFDPTRAPLSWTIDDASGVNGVIRSRLLGALNIGDDDLTRLAKFLLQMIGGGTGPLSLTLPNLSWFYRLAKAASVFELSVDAYLTVVRLMYFPTSQQPPANVLAPSVGAVLAQQKLVTWFANSPFSVYAALYILTGEVSPFFTPAYRPDGIAPFVENLATVSEGARLVPQSFVYGAVEANQAEDVFARLIHNGFISPIGVLQTQTKQFTAAASQFLFDANSFITADISAAQSAEVFRELQNARPAVLFPFGRLGQATLSPTLSSSTPLDFLFSDDADAPNKRSEVMAILVATKNKIHFAEFAFLFVIDSSDFVSAEITPAESARCLQSLAAQVPPLMQLDPAVGQSGTVQAYVGITRTATMSAAWSKPPSDDSAYLVTRLVTTGTAQGGSILALTLAAAASADDNAYAGMRVSLTGGTGAGQTATVVAYDGTSKIAAIEPAWAVLPDNTSVYAIAALVTAGIAFDGSTSAITLDLSASPVDHAYDGMTVELLPAGVLTTNFTPDSTLDFLFVSQGAGQSQSITAYDGPSRTATVAGWSPAADATSVYQVIQSITQGTALGGTPVTIVLAASASTTDNFYNGMTVTLTAGTGAGQSATIYSYVGTMRTATLQAPWTTAPDATSVYAVTQIVAQGTARAGSATTIALAADASAVTGAYNGMTIALIADPSAELKRGQVMQSLLTTRQDIVHSDDVIDSAGGLQLGNAMQGLADFLGTTADRLGVLIPLATASADLSDYLVDLLTPLPGGTVPAALPPFIADLSRGVVTFDGLAYTIPQILAVAEIPEAFVIGDPAHLTLADLASLTEFLTLAASFSNQSDRLIDYLRRPQDLVCPGPATLALSALSQWPAAQICTLEALFWPAGAGLPASAAATVPGLARLAAAFAVSRTTGLDIGSLLQLNALGTLPVGAQGEVVAANWQIYRNLADGLLAAVSAKFGAADFAAINTDLCATLNEARRSALLDYAIWLLRPTYPTVTSPESLYQYLLIDVEMCGCDTTSYIAQAIAAVQLYMQRCRMMVEPGVTDLTQIPAIWWEWMSAYRIWEANRRIFLYPENYIDPALRRNPSPQFKDLVDALMQADVSNTSVANAYQAYFQGFSTVAQLSNAAAYSCLLPQRGTSMVYAQGTATGGSAMTIVLASGSSPIFNSYVGMTIKITAGTGAGQVNGIAGYDGFGTITVTKAWTTAPDTTSVYVITGPKRLDTLFLVAATNTQPPIYYSRRYDPQNSWTPWAKVGVTISASYVSPVYAFDKLFLFWVEQNSVNSSAISSTNGNAQSLTITDVASTIKFSYGASDGTWLPPQTVASDIVVNYQQQFALDFYVGAALPGFVANFQPQNIYWQKAYPFHVGPARLTEPDQYPNGDQIFLNYGFGVNFASGPQIQPPSPLSTTIPADQRQIQTNAFNAVNRYNALAQAPLQNASGFLQLQPTITLDDSLTNSSVSTALINGMVNLTPQPYVPLLNRSAQQFGVSSSTTWNLLIDNYLSDDYPAIPLGTTATPGLSLLGSVAGQAASVVTVKNNPGAYLFDNADEAFIVRSSDAGILPISDGLVASATQPTLPAGEYYLQSQAFTVTQPPPALSALKFSFDRITTVVARRLARRLTVGGIPELLSIESQLTPELPFSRLGPSANVIAPRSDQLDFDGAYGLYFWEIFFFAPFLVADALRGNRRFREAKTWFEYIFNPTQLPESGGADDTTRFWRFLPFRTMTLPTLTQILANPRQISAYNDDPFDPDAIARLRISAYGKAVVMKYVANLIAWGDYLFAQDTRESINEATNLYVMATDLLGPRPVEVGTCQSHAPLSFNDIKQNYNNRTVASGTAAAGGARTITLAAGSSIMPDAYTGYYVAITGGAGSGQTGYITGYSGSTLVATVDPPWSSAPNATSQYRIFAQGIPQFLIKLESSQMISQIVASGTALSDVPFNDINSYFCVPENADLVSYWDQVEDRLYKIRHCMNLAGVVRPLALFAPPINPRDLIQAAASGGGALSVAAQLNMPIPTYRFPMLIEQARALAASVTQLGSELLAALEKKDGEALALLRTSQEKTLLQLTTLIKEQQIEQVKQTALALNESLLSAKKRQTYYDDQIKGWLSPNEIQHIVYMTLAALSSTVSTFTRTIASISYMFPNLGSPFAITFGGKQIGASMTQASGVLDGLAVIANFGAQLNQTMAGYRRREDEWQLQLDLSGYDVAQVQYQIVANQAQLNIVNQDLKLHQTSIAQNDAMDTFLKKKFTNLDLYQWMATRLSVVYFQTYSLALDLARSVQRAYQFETNSDASFVNFGYWDSSRRGLLAGEGLMLALNQMEKAYLENNRRGYEIDKTISLLQLNPRAMLNFIATGECVFELPEKMFDDDFPGHYCRKINSLSVSIPTIVGPYQNIHATLTQLTNQVIVKPDINAVNFLLGSSDATPPDAAVLRNNWLANQSIALSRGLSDTGLFDSSAADGRYLPFEGTGAVSTWRLSMPKSTNHLDYQTITDVILQLHYTARDGGAKFRQDVTRLARMRSSTGNDFFPCAQRFSTQWHQFLDQPTSTITQTLSFTLGDLVPEHVDKAVLTGFYFQLETAPGIDPSSSTPYIRLNLGTATSLNFAVDRQGRLVHSCQATPRMRDVEGPVSVSFDLGTTPSGLKLSTTPQYLDPAAIHNIVLVLFYEGEIRWS